MTSSVTSIQQFNDFSSIAAKIIASLDINSGARPEPKRVYGSTKIRAKLLPTQVRSSYVYAPEIMPWLSANAVGIAEEGIDSKSFTYKLLLLGITNRALPEHKKAGLNLFKTFAKVSIKDKWNNLDQCTVEFGQRLPISTKDFVEEISRQIYASASRVKAKGRLILYCHNLCSTTVTTDLETLRLSIINAMPVINVDWIDASASWDEFWNPCSALAPVQSKLESKLIELLNRIVENVCASQCNVVIRKNNCFVDDIYLPYRQNQRLPQLNKITYLPNTDMQNNRILDVFKAEKNLIGYIDQKLHRKIYECKQVKANGQEWLPL